LEEGENQAKFYPLAPEALKPAVIDLTKFTVMKFPRVLQTIFYLLGYQRDDICERGTNALNFKKAKLCINEKFFFKIGAYQPVGARADEFKEYQKILFLKSNLESLNEEQVEEYSGAMAKLLRWVHMAIDLRCEDVVTRRDNLEYMKQDRESALAAEAARNGKFEAAHSEAKAIFDEKVEADMAKEAEAIGSDDDEVKPKKDVPEFDFIDFKAEFD
jgi:hypothetical protein